MWKKALIYIASFVIALALLVGGYLAFSIYKIKTAPPTIEQVEYRELYESLSEDNVLTQSELQKLNDSFNKAYPSSNESSK